MRVQFNWIHGAFHCAKEDPWRYCYSFYRPNEHVGFVLDGLSKQHGATSQRSPTPTVVVAASILVRGKGKRKIVDRMEEE